MAKLTKSDLDVLQSVLEWHIETILHVQPKVAKGSANPYVEKLEDLYAKLSRGRK